MIFKLWSIQWGRLSRTLDPHTPSDGTALLSVLYIRTLMEYTILRLKKKLEV